jgi:hypothetical protein
MILGLWDVNLHKLILRHTFLWQYLLAAKLFGGFDGLNCGRPSLLVLNGVGDVLDFAKSSVDVS